MDVPLDDINLINLFTSDRRAHALIFACLGRYPFLPLLRLISRQIVDLWTPISLAISVIDKFTFKNA
jgi:hypothetical protein